MYPVLYQRKLNRIKLYFYLYAAFYFHIRILIAKEIYKRLIEGGYIQN